MTKESFSSYLAGFFDGNGSLHFQIVRQKEYRHGFYIRASLVFYQATVAEVGLLEIQRRLGTGRLMRRRGGMSDVTITNRDEIKTRSRRDQNDLARCRALRDLQAETS